MYIGKIQMWGAFDHINILIRAKQAINIIVIIIIIIIIIIYLSHLG